MSSARTVLVSELKTQFNYELRNAAQKQWEPDETLGYVNRWMEFCHSILTEHESDLVLTGSGTFPTVAGTGTYDLSANSMGDLIVPVHVWLSGYAELEQVPESDSMSHVIAKEQGSTSYSQPNSFYLVGDTIGLLPYPDAVYTVKLKYIPNYTALVLTSTMPYKNLFNNILIEGVKILAKNREEYGSATDSALMELFQDRAMSIIRQRQKQLNQIVPRF
jgi:hypothetical protein